MNQSKRISHMERNSYTWWLLLMMIIGWIVSQHSFLVEFHHEIHKKQEKNRDSQMAKKKK